ncbi:MAG: hypothetical protein AAB578_03225, partial [Elusimicrobiota bacterium]
LEEVLRRAQSGHPRVVVYKRTEAGAHVQRLRRERRVDLSGWQILRWRVGEGLVPLHRPHVKQRRFLLLLLGSAGAAGAVAYRKRAKKAAAAGKKLDLNFLLKGEESKPLVKK